MKGCLRKSSLWMIALATLLITGVAAAVPRDVPLKTSNSTDFTDIWWVPAESGWGLQMVHTGSFIYVTIYVYGADGKPTWFGGGLNGAGANTWTGKLYVTGGPPFNGAFNPNAVTVREAGTMTFTALTVTSGTFTYVIDGVTVTKTIQRQPLTLDNYNGGFLGVYTKTTSGCTNPADNGVRTGNVVVEVTQSGATMSQVWTLAGGNVCTYTGTYSQKGRAGQFDATYTCTSGEAGTSRLLEMNVVPFMFTARQLVLTSSVGCTSSGEVIGLEPR